MAELDGLRAIAILAVLAFHSWYFLGPEFPAVEGFLQFSDSLPRFFNVVRRGDLGVDIFFVLSGYLLSWQLFTKRLKTGTLNIRQFYTHRFFRIYPLYLVALMLAMIDPTVTWERLLGNIFAYNIWFDAMNIVIPWSWSLSVELEFYLVVPLLIFLIRRTSVALLFVGLFAALAIWWSHATVTAHPEILEKSLIELKLASMEDSIAAFYKQMYVSMPVRTGQFMFGVAGAWLVVHEGTRLRRIGKPVLFALLALVIAGLSIPFLHNPYTRITPANAWFAATDLLVGRMSFALAIATVIVLMQTGALAGLKATLSARVFAPIARYSFSMYLFHPLFVYLGIRLLVGTENIAGVGGWQVLGIFAVTVTGSTLFGALTWYIIERPAIRFGKRFFRQPA